MQNTFQSFQPSIIHLTNTERNAEKVAIFAGTYNKENLRVSFLNGIVKLQQFKIRFIEEREEILISFGEDYAEEQKELAMIFASNELPEYWQIDNLYRSTVTNRISAGLSLLKKVDESIYNAIHLIIGKFIVAKCNHFHGGSISNMIGTIWLNPPPAWNEVDYADCIIHEYVHQSIFLHEMVNSVFTDPVEVLSKDDALVISSILQVKRSFDKSFHSAFVSFVLMQFHLRLGNTKIIKEYREPLLKCIEDIDSKTRYLTDEGKRIFEELKMMVPKFLETVNQNNLLLC